VKNRLKNGNFQKYKNKNKKKCKKYRKKKKKKKSKKAKLKDEKMFEVGDRVKVKDLKKNKKYNGRVGTIVMMNEKSKEWLVSLDPKPGKKKGRKLALKPKNLDKCDDDEMPDIDGPGGL
jgi:ribosomal protein L21E